MLNPNFVILGVIIHFCGSLSYLIDTLKGKAKPNKVSWFIWALAPFLAFGAELSQGVGIQALMTFMVGFNPLLIFLASFVNKKSEWKLGKLDLVCGGFSIVGLIIWLILKQGEIAIFFAILADGLAAIPTVIKSYYFPETENYWGFLGAAISAGIVILTITTWDFAHIGFPIYVLVTCLLAVSLIKFKLGKYIYQVR